MDVFPAGEVAELSLLTREVVIFIFGLYRLVIVDEQLGVLI